MVAKRKPFFQIVLSMIVKKINLNVRLVKSWIVIGVKETKSGNGYESKLKVYKSRCCNNCPFRDSCCRGKNDRTIEINRKLDHYRDKVRQNLESETGIKLRLQRGVDVESVFGQIKHNNQFRRFYSRGLKNVNTEWGIMSIAHSIKQMAN